MMVAKTKTKTKTTLLSFLFLATISIGIVLYFFNENRMKETEIRIQRNMAVMHWIASQMILYSDEFSDSLLSEVGRVVGQDPRRSKSVGIWIGGNLVYHEEMGPGVSFSWSDPYRFESGTVDEELARRLESHLRNWMSLSYIMDMFGLPRTLIDDTNLSLEPFLPELCVGLFWENQSDRDVVNPYFRIYFPPDWIEQLRIFDLMQVRVEILSNPVDGE